MSLELAIKLLNKEIPDIKNSEILMMGDSINRDLKPAVKLGLRTAVAKNGQISKENGTVDYELENINDLIKIV
ncbi:HAD hydrolase-like protein [Candidatus Bathyarchaeota archaeon]|nr:HAD hydrolase-like protein [Candidatus Bathyarchaeota archaeon]